MSFSMRNLSILSCPIAGDCHLPANLQRARRVPGAPHLALEMWVRRTPTYDRRVYRYLLLHRPRGPYSYFDMTVTSPGVPRSVYYVAGCPIHGVAPSRHEWGDDASVVKTTGPLIKKRSG